MDFLFSLKVFITVADTGNMTSAGEFIFLTQPAVSMQIRSLEEFYRVKLFNRQTDGLKITEEGKIVYNHAKKILQNFDALNEELKILLKSSAFIQPLDKINIGSCILISEIYMPLIIHKFMTDHPKIAVNYVAEGYSTILKLLYEGKLDIALVGHKDAVESRDRDDLKFEQYINEQLDIVAGSDFDIPQRSSMTVKFLLEKDFIALMTECGISCIFEEVLKKYEIKWKELKKRAIFSSGSAVKKAVISGFGWSILPRNFISEELEEKTVRLVELKGRRKPLSRWLYLVYLKSKENIPAVDRFLQCARNLRNSHYAPAIPRLKGSNRLVRSI